MVINRFRGDLDILKPGLDFLEQKTGLPVVGVLPYLTDIRLPEEDSMATRRRSTPKGEGLQIAVIRLPRISNFTDFDALAASPGTDVFFASHPDELRSADVVIIPGTRNSVQDLAWMREKGLDQAIIALHGHGVPITGICGGYQMLGRLMHDPDGLEAAPGTTAGLGLLPCETVFRPGKTVRRARGAVLSQPWSKGATLNGYEIHSGETTVDDIKTVFARLTRSPGDVLVMDGCASEDGLAFGTYLHGLFDDDSFRQAYLTHIAELATKRGRALPTVVMSAPEIDPLDQVAAMLEQNLDMELIQKIIDLSS